MQPIQSSILNESLKRQNINSVICSPKVLSDGWWPETDAIIIPQSIPNDSWAKLSLYFENTKKNVPIILLGNVQKQLLASTSMKDFRQRCIIIDDCLNLEQIPELIRDIISKHSTNKEKEKAIQVGDLILDKKRRALIYKNELKLLTRKEYFLLELLMMNAGRITTRDSIIDYVWDRRCFVTPNTIDVYISRLRKKIQKNPKDVIIKTIPCLGYELKK